MRREGGSGYNCVSEHKREGADMVGPVGAGNRKAADSERSKFRTQFPHTLANASCPYFQIQPYTVPEVEVAQEQWGHSAEQCLLRLRRQGRRQRSSMLGSTSSQAHLSRGARVGTSSRAACSYVRVYPMQPGKGIW